MKKSDAEIAAEVRKLVEDLYASRKLYWDARGAEDPVEEICAVISRLSDEAEAARQSCYWEAERVRKMHDAIRELVLRERISLTPRKE